MIYLDCQEFGLRQANNSAWLNTFLTQGMVCSPILATWKKYLSIDFFLPKFNSSVSDVFQPGLTKRLDDDS